MTAAWIDAPKTVGGQQFRRSTDGDDFRHLKFSMTKPTKSPKDESQESPDPELHIVFIDDVFSSALKTFRSDSVALRTVPPIGVEMFGQAPNRVTADPAAVENDALVPDEHREIVDAFGEDFDKMATRLTPEAVESFRDLVVQTVLTLLIGASLLVAGSLIIGLNLMQPSIGLVTCCLLYTSPSPRDRG